MAEPSDINSLANAAARGDSGQIEMMLLQSNIDVNGKNRYGRTPLQVVKLGCPSVAEQLLRAGADPNVRDPIRGLTPAHDAARDGYVDTLEVLVTYGADVNARDDAGNLPLHLAAQEGHLDVVRFLCECTAEPFSTNGAGDTPQTLASRRNRHDTAKWLEEYRSTYSQSN